MKDYYDECELLEEEEAIMEAQENAPCDNTGMCAGSSCPYFWSCQN